MASLVSLPTELQLQILTYIVESLDEAPLEINFDKEPSIQLAWRSQHPPKDLSLVCSELRQLVLPALFEYACVHVPEQTADAELLDEPWPEQQLASSDKSPSLPSSFVKALYTSIQAFIDFSSIHGLQSAVKSLVICTETNTTGTWTESGLKAMALRQQGFGISYLKSLI